MLHRACRRLSSSEKEGTRVESGEGEKKSRMGELERYGINGRAIRSAVVPLDSH